MKQYTAFMAICAFGAMCMTSCSKEQLKGPHPPCIIQES